MAFHGVGRLSHGLQAAVGGPEKPLAEKGFRLLSGLCPELLEGEPKMIGPNSLEFAMRQAERKGR